MKFILASFMFIFCAASIQAQHSIILKTGEKMNGKVVSMNDGNVKFIFKGNEMTLKVGEIKTINLDEPAAAGQSESQTKGVTYKMAGRKMIRDPKIDNLTMEKGIVVVEITINKYGNVVKAVPGIEGSTTTSEYLMTKAKQAAESAMFDTSPVMPQSQKGTITITF